MVWLVRPLADFDEITSNLATWRTYDATAKVELYSTLLATANGNYLIDPIPLPDEALKEIVGSMRVAGIIVTNSNHSRASVKFSEQFSVPVFARGGAFPDNQPARFRRVGDGDEICDGLRVIGIEGAADGEIALHFALDRGTFIIGDALINFEPYGFIFLPAKYCSNQKQMRRSLRKLLDYKAERLLFAHGRPILSGANERLKSLLSGNSNPLRL